MARMEVEALLLLLGISSNYRGYQLLLATLNAVLDDPDKMLRANRLFQEIADTFHTSPTSVRDNIETLINVSWRKNPHLIQEITGYPLVSRPSVKRFLEIVLNYLMRTASS